MTTERRTILLDGDPAAPQQARLGAALAARGWRVLVLDAPKVVQQIRNEFKESCVELRAIPGLLGPLRARHLAYLAQRWSVDVVHLNFLRPAQLAWARPGMPPYIATAWGSDLNAEVIRRSPSYVRDVSLILQHAAAVTADSWPLLRKAEARMAPNQAPRKLVFWSADLMQFDRSKAVADAERFRRELGIAPGQKILLSPRQLQPHYHQERIVEAFARSQWSKQGVLVLKRHGKGGEDGYLAAVMDLARKLGVAERVLLAPRVSYAELAGLYVMADAAVSLPEADGVPSTFLELMALEVPIIASDLPAYEGVLAADETALVVPPADIAALAAALDRLLAEPGLGAKLTAAGRTWAMKYADWARAVDAWEALYLRAIATGSSSDPQVLDGRYVATASQGEADRREDS